MTRGAAARLSAAALILVASPALAAKRPLGTGERIDLNRASVAELVRLPGVGEKRAQAIVAARRSRPFRRVEDVLRVKGLGRRWLARVAAHVVAEPPSTPRPDGTAAGPASGSPAGARPDAGRAAPPRRP